MPIISKHASCLGVNATRHSNAYIGDSFNICINIILNYNAENDIHNIKEIYIKIVLIYF